MRLEDKVVGMPQPFILPTFPCPIRETCTDALPSCRFDKLCDRCANAWSKGWDRGIYPDCSY